MPWSQRGADLQHDRADATPLHRALALDDLREVLALEVLHDEEGRAGRGLPEVGDLDDVGVRDHRRRPGLAQEAIDVIGPSGQLGAEDLDRELLKDRRVLAEVHRPHAADAERVEDLVAAEQDAAGEVILV